MASLPEHTRPESVLCNHCNRVVQLRTARAHIIDFWDGDSEGGTWTSTRNDQPLTPMEVPDMTILTRTQVQQRFPILFEQLCTPPARWPIYGFYPAFGHRPDKRQRVDGSPDHELSSDRPDQKMDGVDTKSPYVNPLGRPVIPSKPLLRLRESPTSKLQMALKAWQFTYRISLRALGALILLLVTFSDAFSPQQWHDVDDEPQDDTMSLYLLHDRLGIGDNSDDHFFSTYSWCDVCSSIYTTDQVVIGTGPHMNRCRHVRFPRHPQRVHRGPCNTILGSFRVKNGTKVYRPKRPYHYRPLLTQLATMFQRPQFEDQIDHWRNRKKIDGHWSDVYDGAIWESYSKDRGILSESGSLAFLLNVDCSIRSPGVTIHAAPFTSSSSIYPGTYDTRRRI